MFLNTNSTAGLPPTNSTTTTTSNIPQSIQAPDFIGFFASINWFEMFLVGLNVFFFILYWLHLVSKYPIVLVRYYGDKKTGDNKDLKIGRLLYSYRSERFQDLFILVFKHGGKTKEYYCKESKEIFLEAKYSRRYGMCWEFPDYQLVELDVEPYAKTIVEKGFWNKIKYGLAVFVSTIIPLVSIFKATRKWYKEGDSITNACVSEDCMRAFKPVLNPKKFKNKCPICKQEFQYVQESVDTIEYLQLKITKDKIKTICSVKYEEKVVDDEEGELVDTKIATNIPIHKLEVLRNDENVVEDSIIVFESHIDLEPIYDLQEGYNYDISLEEEKSKNSIKMSQMNSYIEYLSQENDDLLTKLRLSKSKNRERLKEAVKTIQKSSMGTQNLADYSADLLSDIGAGSTIIDAVNNAVSKNLNKNSNTEITNLKVKILQLEKESEILKLQLNQAREELRSSPDRLNLVIEDKNKEVVS